MITAEVGDAFQATALSGSLLLAVAVAAAAGLVAFLSPCVLPVVPGYLGYVSGLAGQGAVGTGGAGRVGGGGRRRAAPSGGRAGSGRMLAGSILFVAGFAVVFMILGGFAGALGYLLQAYSVWINRIAGAIVLLMGLVFLGVFPGLGSNRLVTSKKPDAGLLGAPLMGLVFGLSWTPCIGPTYAAIVALSLDGGGDGAALRGGILALAYSLGLGIPFVLFALLFDRALGLSKKLARHRRTIGLLSGALLIAIGVLLMTGVWAAWMSELQGLVATFEPVV
ncbi:cytochrome C biogenesis protein ResC [Brachybacterium sp. P6-10-X1]|uniref:cytochrome c biogenesis CcdA family protein n=1 Tax=Brachybacterium sp. P6-10-X1 TaxID=1903186 RepID=UPI000971742E|nr:cytochrome c biogenesis protein CcdA [Brachybacterium sp. P6-10-X1]APX32776.1 cytochrome C biogenesis protein ResC [Brachybacterium sp. P6-10-X1]